MSKKMDEFRRRLIADDWNRGKEFYIVYEIVNLVTGEWYIGIHGTDDIGDRYKGSGSALRREMAKIKKEYGPKKCDDQFKRRIVEIFSTRKDASKLEARLVPRWAVNDPMCYNRKIGGVYGASHSDTFNHQKKGRRSHPVEIEDEFYFSKSEAARRLRTNIAKINIWIRDPNKNARLCPRGRGKRRH